MPIYSKLLELQKQALAITKEQENPFFHSAYFDINKLLEVIKPILSAKGLVLLQPLSNVNGRPAIKTILMEAETGERIEDTITMPDLQDCQKMGAACTYYRRYGIVALFALESVDDDGNSTLTAPTPKIASTASQKPNSVPAAHPRVASGELPFAEKVEGEPCPACGLGKIIKSPTTGKLFCADKCWLKK